MRATVSCIARYELVAESIGALSFVLYEGADERDTHPLLDLIRRRNPRQDGASLLEAVASHLLLAGNAYLEAVGPGSEGMQVRELYALRPDRMKLVPGPDGWPQAYEYTVAGSTMRFNQKRGLALPVHPHPRIRRLAALPTDFSPRRFCTSLFSIRWAWQTPDLFFLPLGPQSLS